MDFCSCKTYITDNIYYIHYNLLIISLVQAWPFIVKLIIKATTMKNYVMEMYILTIPSIHSSLQIYFLLLSIYMWESILIQYSDMPKLKTIILKRL